LVIFGTLKLKKPYEKYFFCSIAAFR